MLSTGRGWRRFAVDAALIAVLAVILGAPLAYTALLQSRTHWAVCQIADDIHDVVTGNGHAARPADRRLLAELLALKGNLHC